MIGVQRYTMIAASPCKVTNVTWGQIRIVCAALELLHGQVKDIPDAALRPYDARRAHVGFEFAPQPQHLHVDATIENVFMNSSSLQQMLPRKRSLWRF